MKLYTILLILFCSSLSIFSQSLDTIFQSVKYRNIGPFRGGRSVAASGVVNDPFTYYMGTTGGGLWKTTDAGQYWTNISDGYFTTGSVGAVSVSESDPNVVYCGMGEHAPRGVMTSYGDGVYKSWDAGRTWKKMGLELTQHISRIVIHPKNPDIVFVAAEGALYGPTQERGIYKSVNGGKSWTRVLFVNDLTGCSELSMDMNNPQVLYAAMWEHQRKPWKVISGGAGSGLYKSSDGGETWKKIHKGLPEEKGKMAIAVCRSNSEKVFALIESDSNKELGGLFVSQNSGEKWTRVSGDHRLVQRAWFYLELFVDPQNEHTIYALSSSALRSIDGGKTWERLTGTHGDYHDLWINPDNTKNLVIANDGGAAISFNRGKTWSAQDKMPTAQFYRVNVDNEFPYNIYGGQQDNSSVKIASMAADAYGIGQRHWTYSAGGESAFLAFDPDDPGMVMGGSYEGTIEVLDTRAKASTNIMAAFIQYLARDARDMKYRFNWNAPIIWSQHEPNTYYHAAQVLLKTQDMGNSWKEVSPDLTRNEKDKQGKGGGPHTNEAVGAENYGTLSYVAESPHEKGVIWAGSDDGLVHLTRDGGDHWVNVTPKNLKECLINAIEVSPHDPATAYIATTRYKFNDYTPALYKTIDYGKTWTNISAGIPQGAFTRVVREDEELKDLLYAGTETGIYISWNGGITWQAFNLNLPVVPITDLMVKHGDLIVATSGRSFWVLDDLELIRQYSVQSFCLYEPEAAVLGNWSSPLNKTNTKFKGTAPSHGINPANGVVIYYQLTDTTDVEMVIKDKTGRLVRSFSSKKDKSYKKYPGAPAAEPLLPKKKGLNRFVWDMRYAGTIGVPTAYLEGGLKGHKAMPGVYTIGLKTADNEATGTCTILANPGYPLSAEDYREYDDYMLAMEKTVAEMHQKANSIFDMRKQLDDVLKYMEKETNPELYAQGKALLTKMKNWDEEMVQRKSKSYDDTGNYPNKFTAEYLFLINQTESGIPRITDPSRERLAELSLQWEALSATAKEIIETDIPGYNKQLWEAGIGAVRMKLKQ
ncbi:MAG: glycosyl hydrolase [Bacteroidetes bacterium]|nr:MAG: glycosyl hydrolase [Bacteroidota bacterium]